jgi:hypothetical protein
VAPAVQLLESVNAKLSLQWWGSIDNSLALTTWTMLPRGVMV